MLWLQVQAIAVTAIWSTVVTIGLLKGLDWLFWRYGDESIGLRCDLDDETVGLDIIEHRETAYHELDVAAELEDRHTLMPLHYGDAHVRARRSSATLSSAPPGRVSMNAMAQQRSDTLYEDDDRGSDDVNLLSVNGVPVPRIN